MGNLNSGIARISHAAVDDHGNTRGAVGEIFAMLGENSEGIDDLNSSMQDMRTLKMELMVWKPQVDNRMHELEYAVMDLGERIDRALGSLRQAQPIDPSSEE